MTGTIPAFCAALFAGLVGVAEAQTPASPKPAPRTPAVSKTRAVSGVVYDLYSRAPLPGIHLELKSFSGTCSMPDLTATADADGRFRFEDVPRCTIIGPTLKATPCEKCLPQTAMDAAGMEIKVGARVTDLGKVYVADDTWPVKQFGAVCSGEAPAGEAPSLKNNVAMLYFNEKTSAWTSSYVVAKPWLTERILPWPGVLCLKSTYTAVGQYVGKDGRPSGYTSRKGMHVSTQAVVVRLRDGQRFETSASADPPQKSTSGIGDEYGDTSTPVRAWLRKVAAQNP